MKMKLKQLCRPATIIFCITLVGCSSGNTTNTNTSPIVPILDQHAFNFIFVPSFESSPTTNNLSIQGLNHSLLFGQMLNNITANQVAAIYALDPFATIVDNLSDLKPLQSIENYALLNGSGVNDILPSDPSTIENIILDVLQNSSYGVITSGNYVFAMPTTLINTVLSDLSAYNNYALSFTFEPITNNHQYLILSISDMANMAANTYTDGINASTTYPNVRVASNSRCLESTVTISTSGNNPANITRNETVYFVRHVEAHPAENAGGSFDNGNYVCQGQWRALASPAILFDKMGSKLPDYIYSSDPSDFYWESLPTYIRPALTITPFAIKYNMPLNLIESSMFSWDQPESLASYLFTGNKFNNRTVLVAWEHGNIKAAIHFLLQNIYNDPNAANQLPHWSDTDYDTLWKVEIDQNGTATFSNSCEGIDSASLPMACPKL